MDDGVDKLNRKYTLLVFLFLALPIFTKQYIGDPIECFAPVYFAEHQSRYINSYCWTQSTYYMVPVGDPEDDGDQVSNSCAEGSFLNLTPRLNFNASFAIFKLEANVNIAQFNWIPLLSLNFVACFLAPNQDSR